MTRRSTELTNRRIKFIGKRKHYGEWIVGSLVTLKPHFETFIIPDWSNADIEDESANFRHCYEVVPATVGQFTGLLDENGKGLDWRGDDLFRFGGCENVHKIIFSQGCFVFK